MPTPVPSHGVCLRQRAVDGADDAVFFLRTHPIAAGQARGAVDAVSGTAGNSETLKLRAVAEGTTTPITTAEELGNPGIVIVICSHDGDVCVTAQEDGTVHLDTCQVDSATALPQHWRFVAAERGSLADPTAFHVMSCAFGTWLHVAPATADGGDARSLVLADPPSASGMPETAWAFDVVDAPEPPKQDAVEEEDRTAADVSDPDGDVPPQPEAQPQPGSGDAEDPVGDAVPDAVNATDDGEAEPAAAAAAGEGGGGADATDTVDGQVCDEAANPAAPDASESSGPTAAQGDEKDAPEAQDQPEAEEEEATPAAEEEEAEASAYNNNADADADAADADAGIPAAAADDEVGEAEAEAAPAAAPIIPPGASYATPYKREVHLGPHARPDEDWTDSAMSPLMVRYVARHSLVDLLNDMALSVVATQPPSEDAVVDHLIAFLEEVAQLQRRPPTPPHTPIPADATPDLVPAPPPRSAKKAGNGAATPRRYGGAGTGSPLRGSPRKGGDKHNAAPALVAANQPASLRYTEDEAAVKVQSVVRRGIAADRVKCIKAEQQAVEEVTPSASRRSDSPPRAALVAAASISETSPTLAAAAAVA